MADSSADEQIAAAKSKVGTNVTVSSTSFSDRSTTYRSLDDQVKALQHLQATLKARPRQTLIVAGKGF